MYLFKYLLWLWIKLKKRKKSVVILNKYELNNEQFSVARGKFMSEMILRQPWLKNSAFRPVTKSKKEYNELKKQDIQ